VKNARKRTWRPVALVSALILAVGALVAVLTTGFESSAQGATSTPDTVRYVQTTGASGAYLEYVPGDGSAVTDQSLTSGGGCATPSPSGEPLLGMSARVYPNGYGSAAEPAVVGAYKSRTGVCATGQAWQIEPGEGLVFSVGSNDLVADRLFTRASIILGRQDKSRRNDPPAAAQLVMWRDGTVVGTAAVEVPGPTGATVDADTGSVSGGFDTVEIRVLSPATAGISVVGPTSTFTFGHVLCVGETIETTSTDGTASTGDVTATVTYDSNSGDPVCKSYTTFTAQVDDGTGTRTVDFGTQATEGAHLTVTIDWGLADKCRPDAIGPEPTCSATTVDFGSGEQPQTYCTTADPPATPPWCTTDRSFEYVTVGGVEKTHITETWSGSGDPKFGRR
jgi:hypothetical protein